MGEGYARKVTRRIDGGEEGLPFCQGGLGTEALLTESDHSGAHRWMRGNAGMQEDSGCSGGELVGLSQGMPLFGAILGGR